MAMASSIRIATLGSFILPSAMALRFSTSRALVSCLGHTSRRVNNHGENKVDIKWKTESNETSCRIELENDPKPGLLDSKPADIREGTTRGTDAEI